MMSQPDRLPPVKPAEVAKNTKSKYIFIRKYVHRTIDDVLIGTEKEKYAEKYDV